MPVKGAKGKKRKVEETNLRDTADLEGVENPAFENSVLEDGDSLKTPNREDSKFHSLQFACIKFSQMLNLSESIFCSFILSGRCG